jgi:hypothetical protein
MEGKMQQIPPVSSDKPPYRLPRSAKAHMKATFGNGHFPGWRGAITGHELEGALDMVPVPEFHVQGAATPLMRGKGCAGFIYIKSPDSGALADGMTAGSRRIGYQDVTALQPDRRGPIVNADIIGKLKILGLPPPDFTGLTIHLPGEIIQRDVVIADVLLFAAGRHDQHGQNE